MNPFVIIAPLVGIIFAAMFEQNSNKIEEVKEELRKVPFYRVILYTEYDFFEFSFYKDDKKAFNLYEYCLKHKTIPRGYLLRNHYNDEDDVKEMDKNVKLQAIEILKNGKDIVNYDVFDEDIKKMMEDEKLDT